MALPAGLPAHRGFCGRTHASEGGAECERQNSAFWSLRPAPFHTASLECLARCERCTRCAFVSFAPSAGLCAWYSQCDMANLGHWWGWEHADAEWWTLALAPTRVLAPPRRRRGAVAAERSNLTAMPTSRQVRLGIGTLLIGTQQQCALYGWCQGARRLKAALESPWQVDVFLVAEAGVAPAEASDCESDLRVIPTSRRLWTAIDGCVGKQLHDRGVYTHMPSQIMWKWQFVSLVEYDAVFLADLDVDLMPFELSPRSVRNRWYLALPVFLRHRKDQRVDSAKLAGAGMRLLGVADHEAPLNTGQLLLRPSRRLFEDGVHVLRECLFNISHGWRLLGPPRSTAERLRPRFFNISAGGSSYSSPTTVDRRFWHTPLLSTAAVQRNTWRFVAGAEDQGFFWYMFFIRHDLGVYFNPHSAGRRGPKYYLFHYWGKTAGAKPWEGRFWNSSAHMQGEASLRLGQNLYYLSRLHSLEPGSTHTKCFTRMMALLRTAEKHPKARRPSPYVSWNPPTFGMW